MQRRLTKYIPYIFSILIAGLCSPPSFAQTGPTNLNVSGVLYLPSGSPVTQSNVNFRLEIWDKASTCILYSEEHLAQDLSQSKGGFALAVGRGTSPANFLESSAALTSKIFENNGAVAGGWPNCASGANLASGDERVIRVYYDLGGGFVAMSPDVPIASSAYAMIADTLQGKSPADLIQVRDDVTYDLNQANVENVFSSTNYARLQQLLNPSAAITFSSQRLTNLANPSAAQDAATKIYTDTNLAGQTIDLVDVAPGFGGGKVLTWDSSANKWVAQAPAIAGTAGGDLSGTYPNPTIAALAVGTSKLANDAVTSAKINSTGIAANRLLVTDATTGATVTYANCSNNEILKYVTGTGWQCATVASLSAVTSVAGKSGAVTLNAADINGLGTAAVRDIGTAATEVPELDAGGKLATSTIPLFAGDVTGAIGANIVTQIQGREVANTLPNLNEVLRWNGSRWEPQALTDNVGITALNGDVTASGTGLAAATINNGAVTTPKMFATPGANRLVATDSTTGATLTPFVCNLNETIQWTASGWGCATPSVSQWSNNGADIYFAGGKVGIGTTSPANLLDIRSTDPSGSVLNMTGDNAVAVKLYRYQNNTNNPYITMAKARGTTALPAIVSNGDTVGGINFEAYDGAVFSDSARIRAYIDGAPGAGSMPGRLQFSTVAIGTTSPLERMRITSAGYVGIGNTNPARLLDVGGIVRIAPSALPAGAAGDLAFDSAAGNTLKFHNGTSWQTVGTSSATGDINNGGNAFGADASIGTNDGFGLNLKTNGATRVTIDNTGKVGIGTTSPAYSLDIGGYGASTYGYTPNHYAVLADNYNGITGFETKNTSAAGLADARFSAFDSTGAYVALAQPGTGNTLPLLGVPRNTASYIFSNAVGVGVSRHLAIGTAVAKDVIFSTNNTERMRVLAAGNVGIGTTAPSRLLDVAGPVHISPAALPAGAAGDLAFDSGSGNTLKFHNGTSWQTIATGTNSQWVTNGSDIYYGTGKVGIGITSPNHELHVHGASGRVDLQLTNSTTGSGLNDGLLFTQNGSASYFTNQENGNVFIGTSNGNIAKFYDGAVTGANYLRFTAAAAGTSPLISSDGSDANIDLRLAPKGAGNTLFPNGMVGIGTTAPTAKFDIQAVDTSTAITAGNYDYPASMATLTYQPLVNAATTNYSRDAFLAQTFVPVTNTSNIDSVSGVKSIVQISANSISGYRAFGASGILEVDGNAVALNTAFGGDSELNFDSAGGSSTNGYGARNGIWQSTGTITNSYANFATLNQNGGTTADAAAVLADAKTNGGTAGTLSGIKIKSDINAGTVTNRYGINLSSMAGTPTGNDFAIYAPVTQKSYLAGRLGIGTTAPSRLLDVAGPIRVAPSALPASPAAGDVALDSGASNALKYYNGSAWVSLGGSVGIGGSGTIGYYPKFTASGALGNSSVFENAGDLGLGTTSPAAMFEIKKSQHGNTALQISNPMNGSDGDASLRLVPLAGAGYIYMGEPSTQEWVMGRSIWYDGSHTYDFRLGRGDDMDSAQDLVVSSATGYVGIGLTTPGRLLHVAGPMRLSPAALPASPAAGDIAIDSGSSNALKYYNGSAWVSAGGVSQWNNGASSSINYTAGNVGIGVTSPTDKLHVAGVVRADTSFVVTGFGTIGGAAGGLAIRATSGNPVRIQTPGATADILTALDTGNVGIGTTSPARLLQVAGPMRLSPAALPASPAAGDIAIDSGAANALKFHNGTSWQTIATGTSSQWITAGSAIYYSAGAVGIGTTAPVTKLNVLGGTNVSPTDMTTGSVAIGSTSGAQLALDDNEIQARNAGAASPLFLNYKGSSVYVGGDGTNAAIFVNPTGGAVNVGSTALPMTMNVVSGGAAAAWLQRSGAGNVMVLTNTDSAAGMRLNSAAGAISAGITLSKTDLTRWMFGYDSSAEGGSNAGADFYFNRYSDAGALLGTAMSIRRDSGYVGIGTSNPGRILHVAGPMRLSPAALPASPAAGDIAIDSGAANALKYHDGSNWISLGGGGGGAASGTAGAIQYSNGSGVLAAKNTTVVHPVSGFIGIGTSAPNDMLEIKSTNASQIDLTTTGGSGGSGVLFYDTSALQGLKLHYDSDNFGIQNTGAQELFTIYGANNGGALFQFGQPATAPPRIAINKVMNPATAYTTDATLEIVASDSSSGRAISGLNVKGFVEGSGKSLVHFGSDDSSNNSLVLKVTGNNGATNALAATSAGRVGIGTTSPSARFSVAGANTDKAYFFYDNAAVGDTTDGQSLNIYRRASEGDSNIDLHVDQFRQGIMTTSSNLYVKTTEANTGIYLQPIGTLAVTTAGTERLRVDSSGNVGIGVTTPARRLHVAGPMRLSPAALPASPAAGDIAVDSGASNALKFYNGSAWVSAVTATAALAPGEIAFGDASGSLDGTGSLQWNDSTQELNMWGSMNLYSVGGPWLTFHRDDTTAVANDTLAVMTAGSEDSNIDGTFLQVKASAAHSGSANGQYLQLFTTPDASTTPLERLRISSNGNVGIGSSSPAATLDVNGTVNISGWTSVAAGLQADSLLTVHPDSSIYSPTSASSFQPSGAQAQFWNTGSGDGIASLMTLTTANASARLQNAYFGAISNPGAAIYTPNVVIGQRTGLNSYAERMRIDGNGNVGIGTTGPGYTLDLQNAAGSTLARFKDSDSAYEGMVLGGDTNGGWIGNAAPGTSESIYFQNSSHFTRFYTNSAERMRIDASGNVGIGTTNPTQALEVNGTVKATNYQGSINGLRMASGGFSFASGSCGATSATACSIDISSGSFSSAPNCTITMNNPDGSGYTERMVIQSITSTALKVWKGNFADGGTTMSGRWICIGSG